MLENTESLQQKLGDIIEKSDNILLSNFTFDLLDCIYIDIVDVYSEDVNEDLLEGYLNEIKNSLEIMNPDLKNDIDILENLLKEIEFYTETP